MGNSIEWGKSWNPVKGLCPHSDQCYYCYMKDFFKRFNMNPELRLDEKMLAHVPKGDRIFVCSNLDLFAKAIPGKWITTVVDCIHDAAFWAMEEHRKTQYMFLTKNPKRYYEFDFYYPSIWLGTTWDGLLFTLYSIKALIRSNLTEKKFVSFEPLLSDPTGIRLDDIDWIIIGADSRKGQPKPPKEWADYLIGQARELKIPVFVKSNYDYPLIIQEYPE